MLQIIKLIYCIFSSCGLTLVTTRPPTASTGTTPPSTTARGSRKMERPTATSSSFLLWVKTPKHACNQRNLLDKTSTSSLQGAIASGTEYCVEAFAKYNNVPSLTVKPCSNLCPNVCKKIVSKYQISTGCRRQRGWTQYKLLSCSRSKDLRLSSKLISERFDCDFRQFHNG